MDIHSPTALLGGLSPKTFMSRHWQKKPLLIRNAVSTGAPVETAARDTLERLTSPVATHLATSPPSPWLGRTELFGLAARDHVESRLVRHTDRWHMAHGPFERRRLPALSTREWTLLVQGVDLHHEGAHALLQRFNFIPAARLDDLMISYATDGGGVGAHFDSYDVFLLQGQGQRRWRIGQQKDLSLRDDVPLKVLAHFIPTEEYLLNPGDMLYLPPKWAHEGVAIGECMTYSIGFRAPERGELQRDVLLRLADDLEDPAIYADRQQTATEEPGLLPDALIQFAIKNIAIKDHETWTKAVFEQKKLEIGIGEVLTEPKATVWFEPGEGGAQSLPQQGGLRLGRATKMLYTQTHVFVNGESWRAGGADARLLQHLANHRQLDSKALSKASPGAQGLLAAWLALGWVHAFG